jgi:steroid-24-oyl-CoA synthetase
VAISAPSFTERLLRPGSPFELMQAQSAGPNTLVFRHAPPSLNGLYRRAAGSATHTCMHFAGHDVSYGAILKEANAVAHSLREHHGICSGDRVALMLPASPQWLVAFIATTSIGAVAVLIGEQRSPPQSLRALELTRCSLVLADEATGRMLAEHGDCRPRILVRHCSAETLAAPLDSSFEGVASTDGHLRFDNQAIDPEQEALVALTTGSTSLPKAVISTHRAVIAGIMNMMLGSALAAARNKPTGTPAQQPKTPSSLLMSPLTHVGGYSHLLLMMQVAGKVVPLSSWEVGRALELIEKHRIRSLSGANASELRELLRAIPGKAGISSLLSVGIHGEALRENILAELRDRLPQATPATGYGLTETNGSICAAVGDDLVERPDSCGPIVPSVEARILDERGVEVPVGSAGEIWLRGAMMMSGYCGVTQNHANGANGGWFCTEDFGRMDAQGFLYLQQRRQDVFYCGDQPLSVAAIERVVYKCDCVDEAAAFFVGPDRNVTRVVVAVVLREAARDAKPQIAARLASEVAAARCEIVTLARLPRLSSGKIDRSALRQHIVT